MANIDKLVQFAELKVGQFGVDYREHFEHDKIKEIQPKSIEADGTDIKVVYEDKTYRMDLTHSGVKGDVTPEDAQLVVERMKEFYKYAF